MVLLGPRLTTVNPTELRLKLAGFFWVGRVGIVVEEPVLESVLRRMSLSVQKLLRVIWTAVFMCFACTFLVISFRHFGYWDIIHLEYLPHLL